MSEITPDRASLGGTYPLAGRQVARIGYGAMQLERLASNADAATSLLRRALEAGVNHVDTADFYGAGFVNEVIGRAVGDRDDIVVATKIGALTNPGGPLPLRPAQRPRELRASIQDNLRTLSRDRLDLVYLRRLDAGPGLRAENEQLVPLDDQLAVLLELRDAGDITAIGLSGVTIDILRSALPAGIAAVQNAYSVVDREFEEMLGLTVDERIAWIPYFPLGSAFAGYPSVTEQQAVIDAALRLGVTPSQVGLAWLLQRRPNILLIPGTSDPAHLDENNRAGDVVLDADAVAELDTLEPTGVGELQWSQESSERVRR
jgi:aryl-alcohol dehydrogenase-like predicted oxidoreductase